MSDTVIKVENLSKQYRIGAKEGYRTFRETLVDSVKAPIQGVQKLFNPKSEIRNPKSETIWALKDVSFEVKRGEVVGIIGRNGAGKTTLLKILSKITEPTEGRIELRGRVGSLLEVGTGFHPELTGHENVYLYGAVLGMDRWEVTRKFDEIVSFAEIEKFIDTPVKRYSSGMYMRLAFAVAAHLEPEILLVDEVLAVGDAAFQKKCLGKMDGVAQEGRTVLFVSHNMGALISICERGILLDGGKLSNIGSINTVVSAYLNDFSEMRTNGIDISCRKDREGTGDIQLTNFYIEDENGDKQRNIVNGQTVSLVFDYQTRNNRTIENVVFQIEVRKPTGSRLFQFGTRFTGRTFSYVPPIGQFVFKLFRFPLVPGHYRLDVFGEVGGFASDYISWLAPIEVVDGDFYRSGYKVFEKESEFLVDGTVFLNETG